MPPPRLYMVAGQATHVFGRARYAPAGQKWVGCEEGCEDGWHEGFKNGCLEGCDDGCRDGQEGCDDGCEDGMIATVDRTIITMIISV